MGTTLFVMGFFAGLILITILSQSWLLQKGVTWAKLPHITFRKAIQAVLLLSLLHVATALLASLVGSNTKSLSIARFIPELIVDLLATWAFLVWFLKTNVPRAILVWLSMQIATVAIVLFVVFVTRPYMLETFIIPSSAMSPTIRGPHHESPCPTCGSPLVIEINPFVSDRPVLAICSKEFVVCQVQPPEQPPLSSDRFLINKLVRVHRWDIVAFRYPSNPAVKYLFRVVGMPGEKIAIRNGMVYADGVPQQPPDSLRALKYTTSPFIAPNLPCHGKDQPVQLGPDEYFVLGDFSSLANDSRFWVKGAPGHHPYAVPASHIEGVVTHIYWPLHRVRALR